MASPLITDPFQQDFANLAIAAIAEGAGDAAEIAAIAAQTTPADDESFFRAWASAADAIVADAGALDRDGRLIQFTAPEGAGDHCEIMNRPLANQRMLDWLDATVPTA